MHKIIGIILSLFGLIAYSQENESSFNYKAIYELTYHPDSTNLDLKRSENMVLYIGDHKSRFSSHGKAIEDSLMHYRDRNNKSMAAFYRIREQTPTTEFDYNLFKDHENEEIWFIEKIFKDKVKYREKLESQNWTITTETKEIAGYTANKASCKYRGRNYTAWFTPQIPIAEGPYKFYGLPGLIVEIYDDPQDYHFQLKGFQQLEPAVSQILEEEDYLQVKREDFEKIRDNFKRDPLSAMRTGGMKIHWSDEREMEAKKEFREKFKRENNPIELEN
ncbi:GLPGLI family protein [Gramella sp. BOM4]|nr:GLPGLI family protein [Christiangramia bathymodioli]